MDAEMWAEIPDLPGYEVSTTGRVRRNGRLYRGRPEGTSVVHRLQGQRYTIDELMQAAFGDEAEDMRAGYDPREQDRVLTQYELAEIKLAEGWKPAFEVAQEFRIDSARVRQVWDGLE
jgi:hypothetical protein